MRVRYGVGAVVVTITLFLGLFTVQTHALRAQEQMRRAMAEEARARAEAEAARDRARLEHADARPADQELQTLRAENAALKARVREIEQKAGR